MQDLVIALAYIGILVLPIVAAAKNSSKIGKDDFEPQPKTLPARRVLR